jgi:hypothetical protein
MGVAGGRGEPVDADRDVLAFAKPLDPSGWVEGPGSLVGGVSG